MAVPILLEACLDSVELARKANLAGAGRIELCERLDIGGTTPASTLIEAVVAAVPIPVFVIVRPRGGDFAYTASEIAAMKGDARMARGSGAAGIVLGILNPDSTVDAQRTREVMDAANGCPATFHLAFDQVPDQRAALETLIEIGVERVLTSGGAGRAIDGTNAIGRLVEQAAGRISIMAGGSVREGNVGAIVRRTGVREIHTRGLAIAEIIASANAAAVERGLSAEKSAQRGA